MLRRKMSSTTTNSAASNLESSLVSLSLCWNGIGSSAPVLQMVAQALGRLSPRLEELKLCGNPLGILRCNDDDEGGGGGFESLFAIGRLHDIAHVHLSDCDLGGTSRSSSNDYNSDDDNDGGGGGGGCYYSNMKILTKYLTDPGGSKIRTLNLKMNGIDPNGAKILARAIAQSGSTLEVLQLDCNAIRQSGVRAIIGAMAENPRSNLKELSICANLVGRGGGADDHDERARAIWQKLLRETRLKTLRLDHNDLGDEGVVALLLPTLSSSHFSSSSSSENNHDDETTAVHHRGSSCCCLEELHLRSNNLTNRSLSALLGALRSDTCLKRLFVTGNPSITRRGVSSFVDGLKGRNSTLQRVEILEDSYDNHLIRGKLDYFCRINHWMHNAIGGETLIDDPLWPQILANAQRPDVLFALLQAKPEIAFRSCSIVHK